MAPRRTPGAPSTHQTPSSPPALKVVKMFSSLAFAGVTLCALSSVSLSIAAPVVEPRSDVRCRLHVGKRSHVDYYHIVRRKILPRYLAERYQLFLRRHPSWAGRSAHEIAA